MFYRNCSNNPWLKWSQCVVCRGDQVDILQVCKIKTITVNVPAIRVSGGCRVGNQDRPCYNETEKFGLQIHRPSDRRADRKVPLACRGTEKYPWHVGALLINHNCINVQKINYGTHRHHTTASFSVVDTANWRKTQNRLLDTGDWCSHRCVVSCKQFLPRDAMHPRY